MIRTLTPALFGVFLAGSLFTASAAVDHLPSELRAAIEKARSFKMSARTAAIPEAVRQAFAHVTQDERFSMAEPGARWQATDYVVDESLPRRRLQAVATKNEYVLIFYEQGGRGHSYHVSAFRLEDNAAQLVWRAVRPKGTVTVDRLRKSIKSREVDDEPRYFP